MRPSRWIFSVCVWILAQSTGSRVMLNVDIDVGGKFIPLAFHEGLEPIDVIESFRSQHGLPLDFQQRALQTVCQSITCNRAAPVVYSTAIYTDKEQYVGDFVLLQGEEPADAVAAFSARYGLSKDIRRNLLQSICARQSITCKRDGVVLFRQIIRDEDGHTLGELEILDSQEPVDVIFAFLQPLSSNREQMESMLIQLLQVVCASATCSRTIPRIFQRSIVDEENKDYGLLEILYGQEPADAVSQFATANGLPDTTERKLLAMVCQDTIAKSYCTRDRAIVFSSPIQLEDEKDLGVLTLYAGDEVADVLYHFSRQKNLTFEARSSLFHALCNRPPITCTTGHATVYSRAISLDPEQPPLGQLRVMEGEEPADRVYHFAEQFNLSATIRDQVLNTVCTDMKTFLNITCKRFAPVVFQVPITKDPAEPPVGILQILQGEEPIDAIVRFGKNHELSKEAQASMLPGVCEASQLPCTRTRSLLHVAVVNDEGVPFFADDEPADVVYWYGTQRNWTLVQRKEWLAELCRIHRAGEPLLNCTRAEACLFKLPVMETEITEMGVLRVLEGQEPIDQVYAFLEKHDLFQTAPVNESLINVTCSNVKCNRMRPRRILFSMQATYMGLKHTIELVQPEEDWICTETDGSRKCEHYVEIQSSNYCTMHMPGWPECTDVLGQAMRTQLTLYEEDLWKRPNGKDLYAKLGLVKGATYDEIESAYYKLVLRFNNITEPQKYEKLRAAYDTLHDPEKKHYYDLPCLKFFGLCGKRQPDGGISISTDN
ncbi:hypothetical protein AeMF1_011701 [Aphanomyces euteiches]|nr:hypothetical protein AeMF1_011701 [Aphanomyces euteiches]KAH9196938.1 hypothetical protein AeNC1_001094 [Aphanomyces euteiches]